MTDQERIDRAERAKRALEEFLAPAFEVVRSDYMGRVKDISSRAPWDAQKISSLANAARIADEVERQIVSLIFDGEAAKHGRARVERIEQLSPARRRFLNLA